MKNRQDEDFFRYLISGFDAKMQAQLNYMFMHKQLTTEVEHRREMEQMKREITEDVLSRINIRIEQTAFDAIEKAISRLGQ